MAVGVSSSFVGVEEMRLRKKKKQYFNEVVKNIKPLMLSVL